MSEIVLKRANVVKSVDSEDKALALEVKGFIRVGADGIPVSAVDVPPAEYVPGQQLMEAVRELNETKERLEEALEYAEKADKKITGLEAELAGMKEQLEAAVKKNRTTEKKKEEPQ